jgi:hypothetical protein
LDLQAELGLEILAPPIANQHPDHGGRTKILIADNLGATDQGKALGSMPGLCFERMIPR